MMPVRQSTVSPFHSLAAFQTHPANHWNFATTFCLALTIPTLSVISFIVPGVLLQWEILRQVPWIEIRR